MGVSTNGQICFGVVCEEDTEFPWDDGEWGGDIEEWWRTAVCGYIPEEEIYDESGGYIGGKEPSREKIASYHDAQRAFDALHPVPVELVNYCSDDCPMYILAVPSSSLSCSRGYPESFRPEDLKVSQEEIDSLLEFCRTHGIEHGEPGWWLTSYWG
jgi:hypothetical protein